jgi:hypothetical protein
MRAIRFGRQALVQIGQDETLPEALAETALACLKAYPNDQAFRELIADPGACLPIEWATTLLSARQILAAVKRDTFGLEGTRSQVCSAFRHFPEPYLIQLLTQAGDTLSLSEWLLPDDHFG